ncbi:hypothetical protein F5884DRAFT_852203 [Xylogone sp. PMI_703]|nr:hypothetical protein F5884DRAFT_852203 [Xylogone sp. PMI_703]
MGSTYYYYYEVDGEVEVHDSMLPHTSSCPYLPGQPVNLLAVPVERRQLRRRSVSMSAMRNGNIMTMNPADKFVTPRPPPQPPVIARLGTSPSEAFARPPSRPGSPKSERSPWSPRMFFGIRAPGSKKRGRSSSSIKKANSSTDLNLGRSGSVISSDSAPHARTPSPNFSRPQSREPSPLSRSIHLELDKQPHIASFIAADGIAEDLEDDDNFASQTNRVSFNEKCLSTPLSPPPSHHHIRPTTAKHVSSSSISSSSSTSTSKPLPQVPEESPREVGPLLSELRESTPFASPELLSSRFSISTISTSISSRDSYLGLESDDEELAVDHDTATDDDDDDEFVFRPLSKDTTGRLFTGYSLPEADHSSNQTLCKLPAVQESSRTTLGRLMGRPTEEDGEGSSSPLHELLSEMGYLGDVIEGK